MENKYEDDKSCREALQNSFKIRNSNFLQIYWTLLHVYLIQLLFLEGFALQLPTLIVEALLHLWFVLYCWQFRVTGNVQSSTKS